MVSCPDLYCISLQLGIAASLDKKTRSKQGLPCILCAEAHKSVVMCPVNKCINTIFYVLLLLFTFSIDYRIDKDQQRRIVFQQGEEGVYTKIYAKKTR